MLVFLGIKYGLNINDYIFENYQYFRYDGLKQLKF